MPVKNTVRIESPNTFFHVYNRGVEGRNIYLDDEDYLFFTSLLKRHLSTSPQTGKKRAYKHFRPFIDLNAYCLMPNHYHLLIYQKDNPTALAKLMSSIITAYTMYFNQRYGRRGPLFETRYKASPIVDDTYLLHISRYIHLNPAEFKLWPHSSYIAYISEYDFPDILAPEVILDLFDSKKAYAEFVDDYTNMQSSLNDIKNYLANY